MKMKSLFAMMALTALSTPVLAFEGHGFKIISEKVTHSPNFKGGFQALTPKKKAFAPAYASAMAWAYDAEGRVREYIKVQGDHNISLSNYTNQTLRYTYKYTLSCESAYEQFDRTVEIRPQGTFIDSSHSYGTVQKDKPGTFKIAVGTQISGGDTAFHDAYATLRVR